MQNLGWAGMQEACSAYQLSLFSSPQSICMLVTVLQMNILEKGLKIERKKANIILVCLLGQGQGK